MELISAGKSVQQCAWTVLNHVRRCLVACALAAALALQFLRRATNRLNSTRLMREKALLVLALVAEILALPLTIFWPTRVRRRVEVHGTRADLVARMERFEQPQWMGNSFVELLFNDHLVGRRIEAQGAKEPTM